MSLGGLIYLIVMIELFLNGTFFGFVMDINANFLSFFIPTEMYKCTEMNFIGCVLTSMFCIILFPLVGIPCVIYSLFHVGRRKN